MDALSQGAARSCTCAGPMSNTHVDGNEGHNPWCPAHPKYRPLPDFISSECDSWHAALAPTLAEAQVIFANHGIETDMVGDDEPQEIRLARAQAPLGTEWEHGDYFEVNPQGQIVAWEVRL